MSRGTGRVSGEHRRRPIIIPGGRIELKAYNNYDEVASALPTFTNVRGSPSPIVPLAPLFTQ